MVNLEPPLRALHGAWSPENGGVPGYNGVALISRARTSLNIICTACAARLPSLGSAYGRLQTVYPAIIYCSAALFFWRSHILGGPAFLARRHVLPYRFDWRIWNLRATRTLYLHKRRCAAASAALLKRWQNTTQNNRRALSHGQARDTASADGARTPRFPAHC